MNPSTAHQLTALLKQKGADKPCPRCGHVHFSVLGELGFELSSTPGLIGGMYKVGLPTVVVGCNNCGHLTMHATSALREQQRGLLG